MTIKIGNTEIGQNVIAGTYSINNIPEFSKWVDGNNVTHKTKLRDKIKGSFDMFFRTIDDYEVFKGLIDDSMDSYGAVELTLSVNNTNEDATINAFIDYSLVRNRDGFWEDYFERYKVVIEEQ